MSTFNSITVETAGPVVTLTMNRPKSLNAWNAEMRHEMAQALTVAAEDSAVRIVVLKGAGRSFGVGADLREVPEVDTRTMLMEEYWPVLQQISEMPKPVMSVVQGPAAGIHISIILASDLAIICLLYTSPSPRD